MASLKFDLSCFPIPTQLFIDGEWVDVSLTKRVTVVSAVNDQVISLDVQWATAQDVDIAVQSAERGIKVWQGMSDDTRGAALVKYAWLIREHLDQLAWLEAIVVGKARSFADWEAEGLAKHLDFAASLIGSHNGTVTTAKEDTLQYSVREIWSVCVAIIPFNGPVIVLGNKIGAALAAGNAVIVKCPETNPFSTLFAISLSVQAVIPPGVFDGFTGGFEAGVAFSLEMRIRKLNFTGSLATARNIQVAAAKSNLKNVALELGGKSPLIVFPGANIDEAARACSRFLTLNGQGCMLATRVYLHEDIAETILQRLQKILDASQQQTVLNFIETGKKEASLLKVGVTVGDKGCYITPTVFTNPVPNATTLEEEIFGPVVVVSIFKTEQEVLEAANDSEYGLGASVWTNDIAKTLRFARKLEAGTVNVNDAGSSWSPCTPFGGWKQSGAGVEYGHAGYGDWTQLKSVIFKSFQKA